MEIPLQSMMKSITGSSMKLSDNFNGADLKNVFTEASIFTIHADEFIV